MSKPDATASSQDQLVRGRGIEHSDGTILCAACGGEVEWEPCGGCDGGGGHDGYDEDPNWYQPGEIAPCPQCGARGGEYWCANSACSTTVITEMVKSPNAKASATTNPEDSHGS